MKLNLGFYWLARSFVGLNYEHSELKLNMTLTKRALTMRISEEVDLDQIQVASIIQKMLNHIAKSLAQGDRVEFRGFGTLEIKIRKSRVGRNPKKPKDVVIIPMRPQVKFRAGKIFRAAVLKLPVVPHNVADAENIFTDRNL